MKTTDLRQRQQHRLSSKDIKMRPRPVTVLGLLLLLQAVGLFGLGVFYFVRLYWQHALTRAVLLAELFDQLLISLAFLPLALLALLAAIGFLRLWRNAWRNAMLLQGLSLWVALVLYFSRKPGYVYMVMLYGIFMVIYLNYADVYATFQTRSGQEEEEENEL